MKKILLSILATLCFAPFFAFGQQCIDSLIVEQGLCNPNNEYDGFVSFSYSPNIDSVDIYFDDLYFGTHPAADQPIVLSPLVADFQSHLLVVQETSGSTCSDSLTFVAACGADACVADIYNETLTWECLGNEIQFSFNYTFLNAISEGHIFVNGQYVQNAPEGIDSTIILNPVFETSNGVYEIELRDAEFLACSEIITITVDCDTTAVCNFEFLQIGSIECTDSLNGTYDFDLFFEIANYNANAVNVFVNNTFYDTLPYSTQGLPITGITPRINSDYDIVKVCSTLDPNCCMEFEYLQPDCETVEDCNITNIYVEFDCLGSDEFLAIIGFDYTGITGDTVEVHDYNNNFIGFFDVTQQPFVIQRPLDTEFGVIISNSLDQQCIGESPIFTVPCFELCEITYIENGTLVCNDDGTYNGQFFYGLESNVAQILTASINGIVVDSINISSTNSFMLNSIVPQDNPNSNIDILTLCVDGFPNCCNTIQVVHPDCEVEECAILDFQADPLCVPGGGEFTIILNYDYTGTSDLIEVFADSISYGQYNPVNIIEIGPFFPGQSDFIHVYVEDVEFGSECSAEALVDVTVCQDPFQCSIRDIEINYECENDSLYQADLYFTAVNTSSPMVEVQVDGTSQGLYNVNSQPINLGTYFTNSGHNVKVIATQDADCYAEAEFNYNDCGLIQDSCSIQYIEIVDTECNGDGTFDMTAEYGFENANNASIDVFLNGNLFGIYTIGSQVILENIPLSFTNEVKTLTICINDNPDCCHTIDYSEPICQNEDCQNGNFNITSFCIGDNQFSTLIDYNNLSVGLHYDFYVDGQYVGTTQSSPPFIELGPFEIGTEHTFLSVETQNDSCVAEGIILFDEFNDCDLNLDSCSIQYIEIVNTECNGDGTFELTAEYGFENANNASIDVFLNGNFFGFYNIGDLAVLENIPLSLTNEVKTITICINDNPNCCLTVDYNQPDCGSDQDCSLSNLNVEIECDDATGFFLPMVTFEYDPTHVDEVIISANGINYGFYDPSQQPIYVDSLYNGLGTSWEFVVTSATDSTCYAGVDLGAIDCGGDCNIGNLNVTTECDSNGLVYFYLDFISLNGSGEVGINGNGTSYGFFDASDTPIQLGPYDANQNADWEFVVFDLQNDECEATFEFGTSDCFDISETPCIVEEIEVYNIDCIGDTEYSMSVDFNIPGNINVPFTFFLNGNLMNSTSANSLPLNLIGLIPNDSIGVETITICLDGLVDECCFDFTYDTPACLTNAVDQSLLEDVELSPNPTRDVINIYNIPTEVIGLNVIDNLGRSMKQMDARSDMQFDVSNYPEGIYMVQFFTADNRIMNKRFVKMN